MFEPVNKKLERAEYCLDNLKTLASDAKGFAYIPRDKQQAMRANLDCFFFELISAKDFFLQEMNDHYGLGLRKQEATNIAQLKRCLECRNELNALKVIASIGEKLDNKNTWQWQLNNYRNSATHRELLHFTHKAEIGLKTDDKELFNKIRQGKLVVKPIFEGQEKEIPPEVPRIDIPLENIKTYLYKDPEDPSQGNLEVIPYCEESLEGMRDWLEELYSQLSIGTDKTKN